MKNEPANKAQKLTFLHVIVDTNTHEIIATELSLSTVKNGEVIPNLLEQTHRGILVMSDDGVYGMRACDAAVYIKRAIVLIPSRVRQPFGERGHPQNHAMDCQELDG
ncbi:MULTISPECIES: hypothetical protein [unclassified Vibrio]|uniref:hypothetical protein n=1 Tax=unclassified Vibrio TaxID=2614977 RepID=UPI003556E5B3